ncbi:MAG: serine hydrolase domain-containing protein [Pyrinomonadaceae bacterium]
MPRKLSSLVAALLMAATAHSTAAQTGAGSSAIDAFAKREMATRNIPGMSVAVVKNGRLVLAKGYGLADLENRVPATESTVYSIASVTKIFTAMAVMRLVEDGRVSLGDPVAKYFPELPEAWRAVTIRHLLSHTSGIPSYTDNTDSIPCKVGKPPSEYERGDAWKEVACLPLTHPTGTAWKYTETGFYLLGMLIEKVSGARYGEFVGRSILSPLGLTATREIGYRELIPHRATGHAFRRGKFYLAPRFQFDEFSLVSSVVDMARLHEAFTTERILKRSSLDELWTNARLNDGRVVEHYGLGFALTPYKGRRRIGHNGGGGLGFAASIAHFPDENLTVVTLANADQPQGTIGDLNNQIAEMFFNKSESARLYSSASLKFSWLVKTRSGPGVAGRPSNKIYDLN